MLECGIQLDVVVAIDAFEALRCFRHLTVRSQPIRSV